MGNNDDEDDDNDEDDTDETITTMIQRQILSPHLANQCAHFDLCTHVSPVLFCDCVCVCVCVGHHEKILQGIGPGV